MHASIRASLALRSLVAALVALVAALALGAVGRAFAAPDVGREAPSSTGSIEFNRDIRPLLSDRCFHCHGPDAKHRAGKLRLDEREGVLAHRAGGAAIVPGSPQRSALVSRIRATDPDERMPPAESGKELSGEEIALIERWIASGAEYQAHWAYVPPTRPALDPRSSRHPIDRIVDAAIDAAGARPAPRADATTLARRLHLDLLGLPPRPDEIEEFIREPTDAAYDAMVERLLASPHHGERLAIWWLDLVRYADTVGYHGDQEHAASPYRDWVIHAFHQNMPFDRFTEAQLAGDLLPDASESSRIASCYNRLLQTTHEGGAQDREYLAKYAADRVRNVSTVWLGATMGCAECHDHKYDPYTTRDFYSFAAFFADVKEKGAFDAPNSTPTTRHPEIEVLSPFDREELEHVEREIVRRRASATSAGAEPGTSDEIAALEERAESIRKRVRRVMVTESVSPRTVRVLPRGDWMDTSGEVVLPAVPAFLPHASLPTDRRLTRLDLARWLTGPENPQTARTLVNRLWHLLFGRGISRRLDDTGSQGEQPSQLALLDWLSVELIESGWDLRHVLRTIVRSEAYKRSSFVPPEARALDPENGLFARQGRWRLVPEVIRDQALRVSGLLVERFGGESARPYQPAGYYAHLNFPVREYTPDKGEGLYRRGVYTHWQRQFLHPFLKAFDAPTREECTAQRPESNTPIAALALLNAPEIVEAARAFAARVLSAGDRDDIARLRFLWREALSRDPGPEELEVLVSLLAEERRYFAKNPAAAERLLSVGDHRPSPQLDARELAAWTALARVVLNLDETITRS